MVIRVGRHLVVGGSIVAVALFAVACGRLGRGNQGAELPAVTATGGAEIPSPRPALTPGWEGGYAPGDYVEEIVTGGQVRQYRLHVPADYAPDKPWPLVVNLHGLNSNAAEQERVSEMSVRADENGFVVVYPEALGDPQAWHVGPRGQGAADLEFVRALIRHLEEQLRLDPARIYATGISNGAQMADRLACDLSDVVAAIAPVAGGYPPAGDCRPVRPVPVVAFHGTADRLLPYEGKGRILLPVREWAAGWAARNGCDPTPTVTFQRGEVSGETWSNCREGAEVTLYTVEGRGHSWPGSDMPPEITTQDIDASDVIWAFFQAHPLP